METTAEELRGLGELLEVFEEMGGEEEPELEDLLSPYRRFAGGFEVVLKEASSAEEGDRAKVFLMNDIMLVGLSTKQVGKKGTRQKRAGTLDKTNKKGTLEIKKSTLKRFKGEYKLLHYLDLRNCKIKNIGVDSDGFHGVQLTHVSRAFEPTTLRNGKPGTMKVVTKIAKMALWMPSKEICDEFEEVFFDVAQELLRQEDETELSQGGPEEEGSGAQSLASKASSVASSFKSRLSFNRSGSSLSVTGDKQRKWAANRVRRSTLEKQATTISRRGSNRSGMDEMDTDDESSVNELSRTGSFASTTETDSVSGGLSLSDLEKRYNVDLSAKVPEGENGKMEIEVEFGEGRMGFSLGSGAGLGVIVGALAPNGFAEIAGVMISDRVCSINDEEVGLDDHWQEVMEKLKRYPRPIKIKFERFTARTAEIVKLNKDAGKVKGPATQGQESSKTSKAKAEELSKILAKAERVLERGEGTILVLQKLVESQPPTSESRSVASVMEEIFRTETSYVKDLRSLIRNYILRIRNERVKTKCRKIEDGHMLCEHGIRSACVRSASEHQPLLSQRELHSIFLNVETIIYINTELLRLMEMHISTLTAAGKDPSLEGVLKSFADSFKTVMPFFKAYSVYCRGYEEANDKLVDFRQSNKKFGSFLTQIEREGMEAKVGENRFLSLSSLLIKPVQRICKYPLLFNELLRHAKKGAPALHELELAAQEVERIAESVNQHVGEEKQNENFRQLLDRLNQEDKAKIMAPARKFAFEADVMVTESPFASSPAQPRTLLVFNDMIAIAKSDGASSTIRGKSLKRVSLSRNQSTVSSVNGAQGTLPKGVLERSWSKFLGVITGKGDEDEENGVRSSLAHKSSWSKKSKTCKILHQFPLKRTELRVENTPDSFGFVLTVKERIENEKGKSGAIERKTIVNKYLVTTDSQESLDEILEHIQEQQKLLKELAEGHQRGQSLYGTKKEKRNWAKKSTGTLKAKVV